MLPRGADGLSWADFTLPLCLPDETIYALTLAKAEFGFPDRV